MQGKHNVTCQITYMSLRGARRRSNLNPRHGRLLRLARNDIQGGDIEQLDSCIAMHLRSQVAIQSPLKVLEAVDLVKTESDDGKRRLVVHQGLLHIYPPMAGFAVRRAGDW
jgi:hypothetical protein